MLKFITGHMSSIDGVSIYPIISFIIFFIFFVAVTVYVITMKKSFVDEVSRIPLEDDETEGSSENLTSDER